MGVDKFAAEVEFRFEAASLEEAGSALRRLAEAARGAGFELKRGEIVPAPHPEVDQYGRNGYGPEVR